MADVGVRMYNVGFGDCFLVEFPRGDDPPFRVLIDCGSHSAGHPHPGWRISETVAAVIKDSGSDHPAIDVVVATHRHQDHVSGFADPQWGQVTVGEVWLPWTEDPDDPEATRIRTRQSGLAFTLDRAFNSDSAFSDRWRGRGLQSSLRELVANSLSNEDAMRTLHSGFSGKPARRFLSADTGSFEAAGCPGLSVHVLGPSRDESTIRDMDPPSNQSYLAFGAPAGRGSSLLGSALSGSALSGPRSFVSESNRPFARSFVLDEANYPAGPLGGALKAKAAGMMRDTDVNAAVGLDKAVNGTSLMLMFEFGSAYLLFPGDAQWGTWNAALTRPAARELLTRTTFYKVGHHGSHNATPRTFVEDVLDAGRPLWGAAASVHPISFWPDIPRLPLLHALAERSERLLRSDQLSDNTDGVTVLPDGAGAVLRVPC